MAGCEHGAEQTPFTVVVFDHPIKLASAEICAKCLGEYLNKTSTLCAVCGRPILPGEAVGKAADGALHPYTHLTFECCDTGGLFCGQWGEGQLVPLRPPQAEPTT